MRTVSDAWVSFQREGCAATFHVSFLRFVLFAAANLVNIVVAILAIGTTVLGDISNYILFVFMMNTLMYFCFYVLLKVCIACLEVKCIVELSLDGSSRSYWGSEGGLCYIIIFVVQWELTLFFVEF